MLRGRFDQGVCKSAGTVPKRCLKSAAARDSDTRQEFHEPVGLCRTQRERSLRSFAFPDAQPDVLWLVR